jgi:hypothetical protein
MQEQIYSDLWGEVLHKKGVGKRIYLYDAGNKLTNPAIIIHNNLQIEKLIAFLNRAKKEKMN